jgi:hypothetical protein
MPFNAVQRADNIIMLEQRLKAAKETYDKLSQEHTRFRGMALS